MFWTFSKNESDRLQCRRLRQALYVALAVVGIPVLGGILNAALLIAQEPAPGPRPAPRIEGPTMTPVGAELRLSVTGLTTPPLSEGIGKLQEWSQKVSLIVDAPDGATAIADTDLSLGLGAQAVRFRVFFTPSAGGVYMLIVHDANAGVIATKRITVGPVVPTPNPPPGPGPNPGPSPGPSPIPLTGLRVLILEETADRAKLEPAQAAILTSTEVRSYLNSKCAKGAGGSPEFRVFDVDADIALQDQHWKDAVKRPRTSLPWLLISDGKQGFEGPLPADVSSTMELLKKYGG